MVRSLSPAKVLLLAVHLAAYSEVASLETLVKHHETILKDELLLRILLTYLPETTEPSAYVPFLLRVISDAPRGLKDVDVDTTPVDTLSDDSASKKAKQLHLLSLSSLDYTSNKTKDSLSLFLISRSFKVNIETSIVSSLPELLLPFVERAPIVGHWLFSVVLPFVRRVNEYYARSIVHFTLLEFQQLSGRAAVKFLLAQTGLHDADRQFVGRDLRTLLGPWLQDVKHWRGAELEDEHLLLSPSKTFCPGWEQFLELMLLWNSESWQRTHSVISQWDGPRDVLFRSELGLASSPLSEDQLQYLENTYLRAIIASGYTTPASTVEALQSVYSACNKARSLLGLDIEQPLRDIISSPLGLPRFQSAHLRDINLATQLRNDFLSASNHLTSPTVESIAQLQVLVLSAYICTYLGVPWTIRKAGDHFFHQDMREQKGEFSKLLRVIIEEAPPYDDEYWVRARTLVLWLHNSDPASHYDQLATSGIFGAISKQHIETEFLKALLARSKCAIARSIFEDSETRPLPTTLMEETIYHAALNTFDNASNPNRTKGGLKRCDEIIHAFPKTLGKDAAHVKQVEALLRASHTLSGYRLILKQGEPFSPVILRVHSDPIAVIGKVLEQNAKAYTRIQEFLELGFDILKADLVSFARNNDEASYLREESDRLEIGLIERRIVSMCVEAALREDDFETAYSYVVGRLGSSSMSADIGDIWSWNAALKAGQYLRTEKSQQPTHLGTSSGNLEIRHFEQRIECLATALRVAPASELQQILKSFRRCEEQLDSILQKEAVYESEWDATGDLGALPGTFISPVEDRVPSLRNMGGGRMSRQPEEAPMSLFDLSRATARMAQQSLTSFSSRPETVASAQSTPEPGTSRARKRDQFKEAATGTLVSGVGWLIGANMSKTDSE